MGPIKFKISVRYSNGGVKYAVGSQVREKGLNWGVTGLIDGTESLVTGWDDQKVS